jgi:hypothetical protein
VTALLEQPIGLLMSGKGDYSETLRVSHDYIDSINAD